MEGSVSGNGDTNGVFKNVSCELWVVSCELWVRESWVVSEELAEAWVMIREMWVVSENTLEAGRW